LVRLEVQGKQVFLLFFQDLLLMVFQFKDSCSNLTVEKEFYLQKAHTLQAFLFLKVYWLLYEKYELVC
jgi:hypothetical protein